MSASPSFGPEQAARYASILIESIGREYPNKPCHVWNDDGDARPPRELTPAFFGSFDWHSAVHGHWSLLRLVEREPEAPWVPRVRGALAANLAEESLAGELAFQSRENRQTYEVPYGAVWLLLLVDELRRAARGTGPLRADAGRWLRAAEPLETLFRDRILAWLERLPFPIRSGEHSQSAFALGFFLDWAESTGDEEARERAGAVARRHYEADRDAPIAFEPSAHDFLSPSLAEADALARVLEPDELASWLRGFFGELPRTDWFEPVACVDPSDGKLAHFQGLNLSRAWMMDGVAAALDPTSPAANLLRESAARHEAVGVASVSGEHFATSHWLCSFALRLLTAPARGARS